MLIRTIGTLTCCLLGLFPLLSQEAWNTLLLSSWDQDTLPSRSGIQYNDCWGYTDCSGKEYAILGSAKYIHFFDISTPTAPLEIGRFPGTVSSIWRDFKTYQDRAYAVADQGTDGLFIFNLSNVPDTVIMTNRDTSVFKQCHNIFIEESMGRMYVAGSDSLGNGLLVYDLRNNPDAPDLEASIPLPGGYVHDVYVRNNIAYCSHGFNGLYVYDLTDPAAPITLGTLTTYPEPGYNHSSWLDPTGEYLVFADETKDRSLKMANVMDLEDIFVTSLFKSTLEAPEFTNSLAHNPFIRGDYAVVSYYHDGIQIYDLTNPDSVINIAYYDTDTLNTNYDGSIGAWGVYPFLPSGTIIGSDIRNGLFLIQAPQLDWEPVTYPGTPVTEIETVGSSIICANEPKELSISGNYQTISWYFNDSLLQQTGNSILVDTAGLYRALVSNQHCEAFTPFLILESSSLPEAFLPEEDYQICPQESLTLYAPAGGSRYDWYLNNELIQSSEEDSIVIIEPGGYQVEIRLLECTSLSNVVMVNAASEPTLDFELVFPPVPCEEEVLTIQINNPDQEYCLYQGEVLIDRYNSDFSIPDAGNYTLVVSNALCSLSPFAINYTEFEPVIPEITPIESVLESTEASSYQWYRNDTLIVEATEQTYTPTQVGNYSVETIDFNGCRARSTAIFVDQVTNTFQQDAFSIRMFPNPFHDLINIDWLSNTGSINQIVVRNNLGQIIKQLSSPKPLLQIDLSAYPDGLYFLDIQSESQGTRYKVIKF